jgi:glycosyltransferase involved in cell wall biosynthesis
MPAPAGAVSVVIVTRDRPRLLADAFASVARQTTPPLEICLGDDGAEPLAATPDAGAIPVRRVRSGAGHAAVTRNLAARAARGRWLAFLDDDDRWTESHLAGFDPAAVAGATLVYRDVAVVRERIADDGARIELERRVIAHEWDPARMRSDDFIAPSATLIERELFARLGGFDETMRYSEDWDLLLRAARLTTPRRIPGVTVEVRMRGHDQLSVERGAERRECLDRLAARHGLAPLEIRTFWEVAALVAAGGGA